jgi:hypothetical protein
MEGSSIVDITDTKEMNAEIQQVTEQQFDLSMSTPIDVIVTRKIGVPIGHQIC